MPAMALIKVSEMLPRVVGDGHATEWDAITGWVLYSTTPRDVRSPVWLTSTTMP